MAMKVSCTSQRLLSARLLCTYDLTCPKRLFASSAKGVGFFDKASRDWDTAWKMDLTPWDLKGKPSPPLCELFDDKLSSWNFSDPSGKRALVPGCGSGYDCAFLADKGFEKVTGLDLSQTAIDVARISNATPTRSNLQFVAGDFFVYEETEPFDFVFDYLFFAALDPPMRSLWAQAMHRLVQPRSGVLATLIFPIATANDDLLRGPPYPVSLEDYQGVLTSDRWDLLSIDKNVKSIGPRKGREMMAFWRRK